MMAQLVFIYRCVESVLSQFSGYKMVVEKNP